jgi:uncharacterized protein
VPTSYSLSRLFLFLCAVCIVTSCSTALPYRGILWKLTQPSAINQSSVIYIWGVTHSLPSEEKYFLTSSLEQYLSEAGLYMMEAEAPVNSSSIRPQIFLPSGISLSDMVTQEAHSKFIGRLRNLGFTDLQIERIDKFNPLTIYFMPPLYQNDNLPRIKYRQGFDSVLLGQKKSKNKNIAYLETLEEFSTTFGKNCPSKQDGADLISDQYDLYNQDKKIQVVQDMHSLLSSGDLDGFTELVAKMNNEFKSEAAFNRCVILPRNITWAEKIHKMNYKNGVFIAVGAGHLVGSNNLIDLLKEKGFKAEYIEQK